MSGGGRVDEEPEGFAPSRQDGEQERQERQIIERPEKTGFDRLVDELLWGGGEVTVLTLPVLAFVAFYTAGTAARSGATFGFFTMILVVALARGDLVRLSAPWPARTPRLVVLRAVYYSAVLVATFVGGGAAVGLAGIGALGGITGLVLAVVLLYPFPRVAALLAR